MKICEILRREDIGDMGIGAMIVFIAMVLVAGIAASVLVQTANRLEMQAMQTGQQTTAEVATGIKVIDIEGHKTLRPIRYNATTGLIRGGLLEDWLNETRMQNMTITVAPRAGSLDIDLSQAVIEISDSTSKCILGYNSDEYQGSVAVSGVFGTAAFDLLPDKFGIIELEDADDSCSGDAPVINRGDKVMLTINLSACFLGLTERTDIWGMVIPEDGAPGIFAFRTPVAYTSDVYDLY
ncbi:MAG: flagellin [Euryarchaeota archaeon]|nr:flagellin [Euryarchaeota archaeon]